MDSPSRRQEGLQLSKLLLKPSNVTSSSVKKRGFLLKTLLPSGRRSHPDDRRGRVPDLHEREVPASRFHGVPAPDRGHRARGVARLERIRRPVEKNVAHVSGGRRRLPPGANEVGEQNQLQLVPFEAVQFIPFLQKVFSGSASGRARTPVLGRVVEELVEHWRVLPLLAQLLFRTLLQRVFFPKRRLDECIQSADFTVDRALILGTGRGGD